MPHHARTRLALALVLATGCTGGSHDDPDAGSTAPEREVVAAFDGGVVTRDDVLKEADRLPPLLRDRFRTDFGKRELAAALLDKRLLVAEARRRRLDEAADVRAQVRALEERLIVQALIAETEADAAPPGEAEQRTWFETHKTELARPEQVRVGRLLARVPAKADDRTRREARRRAERWRRALAAGTPLSSLSSEADGAERLRGGDMGLLARGEARDPRVEDAAFRLEEVGELSPVVDGEEGYMVLQLMERRAARVPSFEEVRAEVGSRMAPAVQRRVYDALVTRLRSDYGAEVLPVDGGEDGETP